MKTYGYVRVSTKEQNVDRQLDALTAFPLDPRDIYIDYCTGSTFERTQYRMLTNKLCAGDVMAVKSVDRLGRNYAEILDEWRIITHDLKADIVVLDMPLLDTRTGSHNLTGRFISDVMLQLLSYIAEVERENIRTRQAEGIASALARGKRFGRPPKEKPAEWDEIRELIREKKLTRIDAAARIGVSRNTLLKWLKEDDQ